MTAPVRLLHTADWQLGRRYGQFPKETAAILADARFSTVAAINALAREKSVDAVLVAGDVFDSNQLSDADILRGFTLICECPCPIVLLPGNHDADVPGGVWDRITRERDVPAHVHIIRAGRADALVLLGGRLAILAAALGQVRAEVEHLSLFASQRAAQALEANCAVIGLAHGSLMGKLPAGAELSNVIPAELAQLANLDYLALGDWHGLLIIDGKTCYSGTPEPDRFRNNLKGQVLIVELESASSAIRAPLISAANVAQFDWLELQLNAITSDSPASLVAKIFAAITGQLGGASPEKLRQLVLRLKLSGTLSLQARFELARMLEELRATVRLLIYRDDSLRTAPEPAGLDALEAQFANASYAQNVARTLHQELADPDTAISSRATDALQRLLQLRQQA